MNIRKFYSKHSLFTHPGPYHYLFANLPLSIGELCKLVQQLIIHYMDAPLLGYQIPNERFLEMDDRYVKKILKRLIDCNSRCLTVKRPVPQRMVGVCRDYSILLCSILRSHHIPARLRRGFVNYFLKDFYLDAVMVEYWNKTSQKWQIIDPRTSKLVIEHYKLEIDFDLYDVPANRFLPAELAWEACRSKQMQANHFGSRHHRGLWYIRNSVIHELAFILKKEMLIWDMWGYLLTTRHDKPYIEDEQYLILDEMVSNISALRNNPLLLSSFFKKYPGLNFNNTVQVFNPFYKIREENVF